MGSLSNLLTKKQDKNMNEKPEKQQDTEEHLLDKLPIGGVSGALLKDWQAWEDCILSFLRTYPKVREDFNKHVDDWNTHTPLPPSAYEREVQ